MIPDKKAITLVPIIVKHVLDRFKIYIDKSKSFGGLKKYEIHSLNSLP